MQTTAAQGGHTPTIADAAERSLNSNSTHLQAHTKLWAYPLSRSAILNYTAVRSVPAPCCSKNAPRPAWGPLLAASRPQLLLQQDKTQPGLLIRHNGQSSTHVQTHLRPPLCVGCDCLPPSRGRRLKEHDRQQLLLSTGMLTTQPRPAPGSQRSPGSQWRAGWQTCCRRSWPQPRRWPAAPWSWRQPSR